MIEQRSGYHLLRDLVIGQKLLVNDPRVLTAANLMFAADKRPAIRTLENVGIVAAVWRVGGVASPAVGGYHGTLKACAAALDGTGGFVDLSRFQGEIYVAPATGSTMAVVGFEAIPPEGQS